MKKIVKFIMSKSYDFIIEETGERVQGVSCKCYDPEQNQIISVKTNKIVDALFGDDIEIEIKLNGKFVSYAIA